MRLFSAIKIFFVVLFQSEQARRIAELLEHQPPAASPAVAKERGSTADPPTRSDALTLLVALQREARFVDFMHEPLDGFSDAQVGAAAREVHRQTRAVLDRMFGIEPLSERADGEPVEVDADFDPARWKLVGQVDGAPPYRGTQTHHGWRATRCELPVWSGGAESANILTPVEVEVS